MFKGKIESLQNSGKVSMESRVLFINDGSKDSTWEIIQTLSSSDAVFEGISLSRNRGHQERIISGAHGG